ncbi:hypothetical protein ACGC1H_000324 [Rhizoctonia solani]
MSNALNHSTLPNIEKWEEAGGSLTATLRNYLNLSVSLGMNSLKEDIPPKAIATRIDVALETLHTTISIHIFQARSKLAHTRNQILSPTYRLPNEVLTEIFAYVVFTPLDPYDPITMTDSLVKMYRSLHTLANVSCMWRSLALSRGEFWSTVPIVDPDYSPLSLRFKQATNLSLTRATHGDLHLAAIRDHQHRPICSLRDHASRFRTVNITSKSRYAINSTLRPFLTLDSSNRLTELSLRVESDALSEPKDPLQDKDHLFPLNGEDRETFDKLLKSLSVIRICGVPIHWSRTLFSKQLVELHLQDITLGYDVAMFKLLSALVTATELRQLKLISVSTFLNTQTIIPKPSLVVLPKLESLLIQDLYSNTLCIVLDTIASRSYDMKLHLTRKCVLINIPGHFGPDEIGIDELYDPLEKASVGTLLIHGHDHDPWITPDELETILYLMPDLVCLEMDSWIYTTECCRALQRPQVSDSDSFPQIAYLHFSWARVLDETAFKLMVLSHSEYLEQMILGAAVPGGAGGTEDWRSLEDNDEMICWLEVHVDTFIHMDYSFEQPEFLPPKWQLW